MRDDPSTLGSGELASLAGVSTDTLRYYEARDLCGFRLQAEVTGNFRTSAQRCRVVDAGSKAGASARGLPSFSTGGRPSNVISNG